MAIQAQLYNDSLGFPLCGNNNNYSQDFMAEIGNGCFNAQQKNQYLYHQHQQQQQQMLLNDFQSFNQRNDNVWLNDNNVTQTTYSQPQTLFFDHVAKKQRHEIDQFVKYQNERLRLMIQEQRKQQLAAIMRKVEPKLLGLLRDKEEEISRATKKTTELENLLRGLESENQAWQRIARENEAMVVSLSNTLEQARDGASCAFGKNDNDNDGDGIENDGKNNVVEDAESCCGETEKNDGAFGSGVCKCCGRRNACVLLVPCRHFCSCKGCESFLDSCPVCREPKKASIEALTF